MARYFGFHTGREEKVVAKLPFRSHEGDDGDVYIVEDTDGSKLAVPSTDVIEMEEGYDYLFAYQRPDALDYDPIDLRQPTVTLYRALTFEPVTVESHKVKEVTKAPFLLRVRDGTLEEVLS